MVGQLRQIRLGIRNKLGFSRLFRQLAAMLLLEQFRPFSFASLAFARFAVIERLLQFLKNSSFKRFHCSPENIFALTDQLLTISNDPPLRKLPLKKSTLKKGRSQIFGEKTL